MPRRSYPRPDYRASVWMNMVLKESLLADPSTHEASNFRRCFRLPSHFYKKLVEECKREHWFGRLGSADAVGSASIPVELKWRGLMWPLKSALTVAELKFWASNANSREKIDNIFFACGLLQGMLRAYNGLSLLESGTDWCGRDGIHEAFYCDPTTDTTQVGMSGMRAHGGESGQRMEVGAGFC
ncbi:unnamed protein product [Discosporangium mesarthrocarpum]